MSKKALLVGVEYYKMSYDLNNSLEELKMLAEANDIETIATMSQKLNSIDPRFHIGVGKVEEVLNTAKALEVDTIIFNEELTPLQYKNLYTALEDYEVIDRTVLILNIFESRAKTREARLQVNIAKLKFEFPRLVGASEKMIGQQGGSGFRGSGEKQIEIDRRNIRAEISRLDKELEEMVKQRQTQRAKRNKSGIKTVALVGYTNSGKSTLMNRFLSLSAKEDKQVLAKDMLFATLETSTRKIELDDKKKFLLIDTVGFVDLLPHHLVKAFRSTLEEVIEADLLVHVIDCTNDNYLKNAEVTNQVLSELGVKDTPMIYAYNKIDAIPSKSFADIIDSIEISAKTGYNFEELINLIKSYIFKDYITCEFIIPYSKGDIVSLLNEDGNILEKRELDNGTYLKLECDKAIFNRFKDFEVKTSLN